jgi:hypothetical protein
MSSFDDSIGKRPRSSGSNFIDMLRGHFEKVAKLFSGKTSGRPENSNSVYGILFKFREIAAAPILHIQARQSSMPVVLSVCSPFEITHAVVLLVSVFVVHGYSAIRLISDECLSNKRMNAKPLPVGKCYSRIPLLWLRVDDSFGFHVRPAVFVNNSSGQCFDSTKRGNKVKQFIAFYRAPFFVFHARTLH